MSQKRTLCIGVTGLNNTDNPGPGIPVIRSLRESTLFDVRIIGLSYDALEPGLYLSEWVDKSYQIPLPTDGTLSLINRIKNIHAIEKFDLIIPNFDAELHNFIKMQSQLEDLGIATFLPTLTQFNQRQKSELFTFGENHGLKVPEQKLISTASELPAVVAEFGYPMAIKGKYYDAKIVYHPEEALHAFYQIANQWGLPLIAQRFVQGMEVNVTAIGDGKGRCVGAVPMRKLYITDKGKAWAGVSLSDPQLLALTQKVMAATSWKGGCELEFRKNEDGTYYLLEMNPRFPAWVYLATACGQNHPEALVAMALQLPFKPFTEYSVGKMFIRYSMDAIVEMEQYQQIQLFGEL